METESFRFEVLRISPAELAAAPREVAISHPISIQQAGNYCFKDPGLRWESIKEDALIQIAISDWVVARLEFLLQASGKSLNDYGMEHGQAWCVCFKVFADDTAVADLVLIVAKGVCSFSGQADSYYAASAPCEELVAVMSATPQDVAKISVSVPDRKTPVGWTGKKFLTQKKIARPTYYSAEAIAARKASREATASRSTSNPTFSIRVSNIGKNAARRSLRYTDVLPPSEIWADYPNWKSALDEEGRSGQDETTLKPTRTQSWISDDVEMTAAAATTPDGSCYDAMIELSDGRPLGVVLIVGNQYFDVRFTMDPATVSSDLTASQRRLFPLHICSNIPLNPRSPRILRLTVDDHGRVAEGRDDR